MVDAGAVIKLDGANVEVGRTEFNIDRSGAALQVLGTPEARAVFTSRYNDFLGGVQSTTDRPAAPKDWGGIAFRPDSDYENEGIFLNTVNFAIVSFGGGTVNDRGTPTPFDAIDVEGARPTISNNIIVDNGAAAISGDPNSFTETDYGKFLSFTVDYSRRGMEVYGNRVTDNSFNGLFVRTLTPISANF